MSKEKKKLEFNNLISNLYELHSCVPSSPAVQIEFFHRALTVNSCLPGCSKVSLESVVYVLKNKRLIFQSFSHTACVVSSVPAVRKKADSRKKKADGKGESKVVENIKASGFCPSIISQFLLDVYN